MIRLHDGRTCHAALVARDRRIDLAILRISISGLEAAPVRHSDSLRVGEIVMAVGHPLGEAGAVSIGTVHAASRGHLIEADIRLLPGNSGGPLADVSGRVVGINSVVANGMGVGISTAAIEQFLAERLTPVEGTG
jgi:serine protease Do